MTKTATPTKRRYANGFSSKDHTPARNGFPVAASIQKMSEEELTKSWARYVQLRGKDRKSRNLTPEAEGIRNGLMEHYLFLVKVTAERLHAKLPKQVDLEELKGAGVFGLMDAINLYDPARGVRFEAYGKQRIHGAILDELRALDFAPRTVRSHGNKMEAAFREFEGLNGRPPSQGELAEMLDISVDDLDQWQRESQTASMLSLDRATNEHDSGSSKEMTRGDTVEDATTLGPVTSLEKKELLNLATRGLSRKEKLIVLLYYLEELTMKEIGVVLDLSESRVCQIHNRIISQLKRQLDDMRIDLLDD